MGMNRKDRGAVCQLCDKACSGNATPPIRSDTHILVPVAELRLGVIDESPPLY